MTDKTEWRKGDFVISTEKERFDRPLIQRFLSGSYWAKGIPLDVVEKSIENALCFGVYKGKEQVGFARVITDYATFAYLADVFVLEGNRGEGLGVWLMEVVMAHPDLRGLRRWMLVTRDAHRLYEKTGWRTVASPERFMEIVNPNIYVRRKK